MRQQAAARDDLAVWDVASASRIALEVVDRDVPVRWMLNAISPGVTGHVLEAGSAPGLANLAAQAIDGGQASVVFTAVPPGRYYVRVRARDVTGLGEPSDLW